MFLCGLTEEEGTCFLGLAKLMIAADGVIARQETRMLEAICREMRREADGALPTGTAKELCTGIERQELKIYCLLELASIAHVDNDYAAEERALLHEIAELWAIPSEKLPAIERWADDRIKLAQDAAKIVAPGRPVGGKLIKGIATPGSS